MIHSLIASNQSPTTWSHSPLSHRFCNLHTSYTRSQDYRTPMAHDRRPMSREEEDYYYHQRSHSQGGNNGHYDDTQGNPYAYYSQPQASPEYVRNEPYRGQEVARDRYRDRYYSEDEDDVSDSNLLAMRRSRFPWTGCKVYL